jgi:hypothetical protein
VAKPTALQAPRGVSSPFTFIKTINCRRGGERVLSTPCILDGWIYIGGSCGRFFAFH